MKRKLMIGHNMWFDGYRAAKKLGGLACPSIAIFASDIGFHNFGQMTFLIDPKKFDPKNTPVFESDVYSIRMPRPTFRINAKEQRSAAESINEALEKIGIDKGELYSIVESDEYFEKGIEEVVERAANDIPLLLTYLAENGVSLDIPREPLKPPISFLTQETFQEMVDIGILEGVLDDVKSEAIGQLLFMDFDKHVNNIVMICDFKSGDYEYSEEMFAERKKITLDEMGKNVFRWKDGSPIAKPSTEDKLTYFFNKHKKSILSKSFAINKDELLKSALGLVDAEKFKEWVAEKLGNISEKPYFVRNGKKVEFNLENLNKHMKGNVRGIDNNVFINAGNIRSYVTEKLSSKAQIVSRAHMLTTDSVFKKVKDESNEKFSEWPDKLKDYYLFEVNSYHYRSSVYDIIADYVKSNFNRSVLAEGFKVEVMPEDLIKELNGFITGLKEAPTTYFEAKYQRIMEFSEFDGVIVPNDTPKDILLDLNRLGLKVVGYEAGNKRDRQLALNRFGGMMMETDFEIYDTDFVSTYVEGIHSRQEDLEEGDLLNRVDKFLVYEKMSVPISDINLDEWSIDEDLVGKYVEEFKKTGAYPEIVFDDVDKSVIDGIHRVNALVICGEKHVNAFVGVSENLNPDYNPDGYTEDDECDIDEMDM